MAVRRDLLDLKLLLGQFLGQDETLLVSGALQVLHLGLSYSALPLLLLGGLLVLDSISDNQLIYFVISKPCYSRQPLTGVIIG